MKLYFSPLACSLASRIAIHEAGADVTFVEVDPNTKRTLDGVDFRTINPLALVPALLMDDGEILTENAAILQYVADRFPHASLAPTDLMGRSRLRQWLSFVGTELHKALYVPLLAKGAPEGAKTFALSKAKSRLDWVSANLQGREHALGSFTVVDAYLFAVLNWSTVTPVDLSPWPTIVSYHKRLHERPSVARAFAEERTLYGKELERHRVGEASAGPV